MKNIILAINPGSTSTKIALYEDHKEIIESTIRHSIDEINQFQKISQQKDFRKNIILSFLLNNNIDVKDIDIYVGRGGLLKPIKSGTYLVNEEMIKDLEEELYGSHASNLGAILAYELANSFNKPAYIVDPVVVDELSDIARVTGLKGINKISIFHALNQKAVAKRYAKENNKKYEDLNLIIAHLGGGITIGYHHFGKVIDVNNGLGGEGPFSPERSGTMPTFQMLELLNSNKYSLDEIKKLLVGKGGLVSYLGTSNGFEISKRIENNDQDAKFYFQAMAYQIAKEIGSLYFIAKGKIDAIIITGGLAYNPDLMGFLTEYINPIKLALIYPGEDEMASLVEGVLRVTEKTEEVQVY